MGHRCTMNRHATETADYAEGYPPRRRYVVTEPQQRALTEMRAAATELDAITAAWGCGACSPEKCTHILKESCDGLE